MLQESTGVDRMVRQEASSRAPGLSSERRATQLLGKRLVSSRRLAGEEFSGRVMQQGVSSREQQGAARGEQAEACPPDPSPQHCVGMAGVQEGRGCSSGGEHKSDGGSTQPSLAHPPPPHAPGVSPTMKLGSGRSSRWSGSIIRM